MDTDSPTQIFALKNSYQTIEVYEQNQIRSLGSGRNTIQSSINLEHPERIVLPYMKAMCAFRLFQENPQRYLMLGLGAGDLCRHIIHFQPEAEVTAIEVDPDMPEIAKSYFKLPQSDQLEIIIEDAGNFIRTTSERYDTLLIDIYLEPTIPAQLATPSFFQKCYKRLSYDGVMVVNILTSDEDEFKTILWNIHKSFKKQCLCLTSPGYKNMIVLAFKQPPQVLAKDDLLDRAKILSTTYGIDYQQLVDNLFMNNPVKSGQLGFPV